MCLQISLITQSYAASFIHNADSILNFKMARVMYPKMLEHILVHYDGIHPLRIRYNFFPGGRAHGTVRIGAWVGSRADLDNLGVQKKSLAP